MFCVFPFASAAELPQVLKDNFGATVLFQGANIPGVPYSNNFGGQTLQIDQFDDRAILHWDTFNVSQNNEVLFNQPGSSSIALNRVLGDVNAASIIDGHITANGRVFIINHDGIIFGENAVVNTRNFIASTLDIRDDVFMDIGFESAINENDKADGLLPAFFFNSGFGRPMGEINIQAGASITSAENGRVLIFAPTIVNSGDIQSPGGQIVLAAVEDEVYIAPAGENDDTRGLLIGVRTGGDVTNLGSLIAERGNVSLMGLAVNQLGLARATTSVSLNGSVLLLAQDMGGSGVAPVFSGAKPVEADDEGFKPVMQRGGELVLGTNSITEVIPDDSDAMATDAQIQNPSVIKLKAEKILLQSGSITTATGGDIDIEAASNPRLQSDFNSLSDPALTPAEIIIESGAVIDASGDDTTVVSVARNFIEVEARGNQLADSPLQQDGAIRNETLIVDIRNGTDFLNIDAEVAAIERDIHERLSPGGTIDIKTVGQITVEQGAVLDISGGSVTYTGGQVAPSQLVTVNGDVYDISDASKNLVYAGVLGDISVEHEKWGITEVYQTAFGHFEQGYIEGRDAGVLTLNAPGISFEGELVANAAVGIHQRFAPEDLGEGQFNALARSYNQVPLGGKLVIQHLNSQLQDVIIGEDDGQLSAENGHPVSLESALVLSPELFSGSGVSRIQIDNAGRVIVNRDLELDAFSDLALLGTQVLVQSDIRSPGGSVTLVSSSTLNGLVEQAELGPTFNDASTSLIEIDGIIDTAGRWSNDSAAVNAGIASSPVITQGGSISISSGRDVVLTAESLLDVSGGAYLNESGKLTGGKGGDITITSAKDSDAVIVSKLDLQGELRAFGMASGGSLVLNAEAISIQNSADSAAANVASDFALVGAQQFALIPDATGLRNVLAISAEALQLGGFQSYELNAEDFGLDVAPGSQIELSAVNQVVDTAGILSSLQGADDISNIFGNNTHPLELVPTGTAIDALSVLAILPEYERGAVDLVLSAGELGPLVIGSDAVIDADPGATITLNGRADIIIDGTISAPAGKIEVTLAGSGGTITSIQNRIFLGDNALLLAPGAVMVNPVNEPGLRTGEVLDAGLVSLKAEYGSIIGNPGAQINVDAVSAELDIGINGALFTETVGSDAGTIEFSAAELFIYNGELSAQGVPGQQGGQLAVTLDPNSRGSGIPDTDITDAFNRGEYVAVFEDYSAVLPAIDTEISDDLFGYAYIPLSQLKNGGFDSLDVTVRGPGSDKPDTPDSLSVIEFTADTEIALDRRLSLDAAVIRATADSEVTLIAPYVALGSSENDYQLNGSKVSAIASVTNPGPGNFDLAGDTLLVLAPTAGDAHLRVEADLIELIGELVTQGIGHAGERLQADGSLAGPAGVELVASQDLRLRGIRLDDLNSTTYNGLFLSAADVSISADRIYPVTLTDFELTVEGSNGSIEFISLADTEPAVPLSIGGGLSVNADYIRQGGNLYAPLGRLEFNAAERLQIADGSLTSSSGYGVQAPFFVTQPGGDLVIGGGNGDIIFVESESETDFFDRALPQQLVLLNSPDVEVNDGARFDLRGGTDAFATEFIPGPGGSRDILLADLDAGTGIEPNESFAIVPGIAEYAPYDPLLSPQADSVQGFSVGDTLILEEGIDGLPAGEYAILPARYALFGGFLVTPVAGTQDLFTGLNVSSSDGVRLLAGRYGVAGNDSVSARSQGFAVADGDIVRTRAEYLETSLADIYTEGNVRSPDDAGTLTIEAQNSLQLAGQLVQNSVLDESSLGRGSQVNIVADIISILNTADGSGIQLEVSQLEQFGADSLLIGGRRETTAEGLLIESVASEINVAAGVELDVPELILVADVIDVQSSTSQPTRLQSTQPVAEDSQHLIIAADPDRGINGDAAVIAVSDRTLTLERSAPTGSNTGELTLSADAVLQASGSIVADVAGSIQFNGGIEAEGALVNLGASDISLGETDGQAISSGLVLSNDTLTGLDGSRLRLRSDNAINIFGRIFNTDNSADLKFAELDIDSQSLVGIANDNDSVQLVAGLISLSNSTGSVSADTDATANGSALSIFADQVSLGDGVLKVQGYDAVNAVAANAILLNGDGELLVEGPLNISAPVITGVAGADYALTAQDAKLTVTGADPLAALPAASGLAASLDLQGASVDFAGRVVLPSGSITLHQQGDIASPVAGNNVEIRPEAVIDVAGMIQSFGPEAVVTGGGSIYVLADTGNINVSTGGKMNVSAGDVIGEAGVLQFDSANGRLTVSSGVEFVADGNGGSFILDTDTLVASAVNDELAYTALSNMLGSSFKEQRNIHLRSQGILHDEALTVHAHDIRLVSDSESVVIRGNLDASGQAMDTVRENGGSIVLAAGDSVDIESTAVLRATGTLDETGTPATGTHGGTVQLFALDADSDDAAAVNDRVNLEAGAVIDVSGGDNPVFTDEDYLVTALQELGGKVLVHTRLIDAGTDALTDPASFVQGVMDAVILGAATAELVVTNKTVIADGEINAADIAALRTASINLVNNAVDSVNGFQVAPGLLLESSADLILKDAWDFYGADTAGGWHFGQTATEPGVAGYLVLRAAGDVILEKSITDSFFTEPGLVFFGIPDLVDRLDTSPQAWSYSIAAGSDLSSADLSAIAVGSGDIIVNDGVVIRTGTGDIAIAAANNISLGADAAIYTGGYDRGLSQHMLDVMPGLETGFFSDERTLNKWLGGGAIFPVDGGDVSVYAGGNIASAAVPELPSEWQPRIGASEIDPEDTIARLSSEAGLVPTNWGIAFHRFTGIGALGGGTLKVTAGGDLNNVVLAVPTTGRTIAGAVHDGNKFVQALETTEVAGGGVLQVNISGNASDALFYLGDGAADIYIQGDSGNKSTGSGTQIYAGFDSRFSIVAGGDLNITEVQDPGTVSLSDSQGSLTGIAPGDTRRNALFYDKNRFFTYTDSASIDIHALSGTLNVSGTAGTINAVAPVFKTVSHSGDLIIESSLFQYPSPHGQLELLADQNIEVITGIGTGGVIQLVQSDQEAALLPGIQFPAEKLVSEHAEQPVHVSDSEQSLIIANNGSISTSGNSRWNINMAEALYMEAGIDIDNVSAQVQNNSAEDVTSFIAGRDILQPTQRNIDGTFLSLAEEDSDAANQFEISGPGTAEFIAGRSINLGTSDGIETVGNIKNRFLPEDGADLILMAGLGEGIDTDSFIQTYFVDGVESTDAESGDTETVNYQQLLQDYLKQRSVSIQNDDAVATFQSLDLREQLPLLADILFAELRASGVFAQESGTNDYSRGFNVINALFPQNDPQGGISMLLSQVNTLDGGDIDLLVPGGLINAGTASSDIIAKGATELGIVAAKTGDVNVMVDGDLLVNSTRVFALQGDLTVWSSNGDIDAGKGAKTVTAVPDPITRIGPTGETIIEFPPAVEGSGLQGVNAFLFAPTGVINAGDAGIRTIGNLTIGATAVTGADNIDVGGASVGVPTASAGVGAGVAGAGDATKSATDIAEQTTDFGNADEGSTTLGILSVNVEGFGDCAADDEQCRN